MPLYGYADAKDSESGIKKLSSSYRLKKGNRPAPPNGPGGKYDGTFSKDYEYVKGSGDLDQCNGRFTVTKEFPKGTYAYFLTGNWPVIPRYFKAEPLEVARWTPACPWPAPRTTEKAALALVFQNRFRCRFAQNLGMARVQGSVPADRAGILAREGSPQDAGG